MSDRGLRERQSRALRWALGANALLLIGEVAGGLAFGSLALLADAAHVLSDLVALGIALVAQGLLDRPATHRHSFGLQRAEVLGAQVNGLVLLAVSVWIVVEAVERLGRPVEVVGGGLLVVALIGLFVNIVSAIGIHRVRGESLNMRGALLHLGADALGSVAAVIAGVAVVLWDATWTDPAASIAVAALVLWSAWHLLRETTHVLLEGTPKGIDLLEVERVLVAHPEVEGVHHLHVWNIASDVRALSAHIVVREERSLHEAQVLGDALKADLADRFDIPHATLELECHTCDDETPVV